ncbi:hypothetical protein [Candidatus Entotheonella palauensis]|uniref:Ankyrin n=1 Tax=Candidatus Entotheonella gemina TaxID=1429439 RepID=W4MC71_9BACT|nr:hypothetical protein [Candidatus Entotheonella palauensis]ETX07237.1 MAG: hypothetical protein ETSY2_12360 [Candidatus Entotheonella gemina]
MLIKHWRDKKQKKLNNSLKVAILSKRLPEVRESLCQGADPNALLTDREYALDLAMQVESVPIIDALLAAGGDPRKPYHFGGENWLRSDFARWAGKNEAIVNRLSQAEQEAESQYGSVLQYQYINPYNFPKFMY